MNAVTFDTYKIVTKLTERGFSKDQAEGVVEVLSDEEFVTKPALEKTEESIVTRLRAEIAHAKTDMIKWIAGMLLVQAALIAALVELV